MLVAFSLDNSEVLQMLVVVVDVAKQTSKRLYFPRRASMRGGCWWCMDSGLDSRRSRYICRARLNTHIHTLLNNCDCKFLRSGVNLNLICKLCELLVVARAAQTTLAAYLTLG